MTAFEAWGHRAVTVAIVVAGVFAAALLLMEG